MSRTEKLFAKLEVNPEGVKFRELQNAAAAVGFLLKQMRGSHHRYEHHRIQAAQLNIQPDGKMAKAYQVRQLLAMIKAYNLRDD